jgi:hypothetical protein
MGIKLMSHTPKKALETPWGGGYKQPAWTGLTPVALRAPSVNPVFLITGILIVVGGKKYLTPVT